MELQLTQATNSGHDYLPPIAIGTGNWPWLGMVARAAEIL